MTDNCPCGNDAYYANCCGVYHTGVDLPDTAVQLMRSRYSAYALKLVDYLVETTHRDKLKSTYRKNLLENIDDLKWTKLEILKTSAGGKDDKVGKVKFEASYIELGKAGKMIEHSSFRKLAGRWYYYDGKG